MTLCPFALPQHTNPSPLSVHFGLALPLLEDHSVIPPCLGTVPCDWTVSLPCPVPPPPPPPPPLLPDSLLAHRRIPRLLPPFTPCPGTAFLPCPLLGDCLLAPPLARGLLACPAPCTGTACLPRPLHGDCLLALPLVRGPLARGLLLLAPETACLPCPLPRGLLTCSSPRGCLLSCPAPLLTPKGALTCPIPGGLPGLPSRPALCPPSL